VHDIHIFWVSPYTVQVQTYLPKKTCQRRHGWKVCLIKTVHQCVGVRLCHLNCFWSRTEFEIKLIWQIMLQDIRLGVSWIIGKTTSHKYININNELFVIVCNNRLQINSLGEHKWLLSKTWQKMCTVCYIKEAARLTLWHILPHSPLHVFNCDIVKS